MKPPEKMPNVAIIGAGPAGSCAAILLSRAGWRVHLFEQHRFPRNKVCGECLSPLAIEVLDRLNLTRALRAQNLAIFRQSVLVARDGSQASIDLPRPMWGISRSSLDSVLLQTASDAGVTIHQPSRVEKIDTTAQRITARELGTNTVGMHSYDYLLLADGKSCRVRFSGPVIRSVRGNGITGPLKRTLRALVTPEARNFQDLGVKAHFTNVRDALDVITLFSLPHHYCGLAPIENGLWNIAMSVPAARVREFDGDLEALWQKLLTQNAGLARRMQDATRVSDWLASLLPRFAVRSHWPDRVIPLGNAAAALEPIGGEGIGLALRSAELAASHLVSARFNPQALRRAYQKLWTTRRLVCRTGALILSRPTLASLAVRLLNSNRQIGQTFIAWTGKTAHL
jgi:2-polyprenyl-6-methoxyphenol hydroxylase-like FAD-dependent oxidoreductase